MRKLLDLSLEFHIAHIAEKVLLYFSPLDFQSDLGNIFSKIPLATVDENFTHASK